MAKLDRNWIAVETALRAVETATDRQQNLVRGMQQLNPEQEGWIRREVHRLDILARATAALREALNILEEL